MKLLIISFTCLVIVAVSPASGGQQKQPGALYEIKRCGKIGSDSPCPDPNQSTNTDVRQCCISPAAGYTSF